MRARGQVLEVASRDVYTCPFCGSSNIVVDYAHGQVVCRSCGYVIEDTLFDISPAVRKGGPSREGRTFRYINNLFEERRSRARLVLVRSEYKLASSLGEQNPFFDVFSEDYYIREALSILSKNKCLRKLLAKRSKLEAAAALHVAITLANNDYPLLSEIAETYGVEKKEVRRLLSRIRKCLGIESFRELLAKSLQQQQYQAPALKTITG
ncbi:MAG: hypothetical protein DSY37_01550 [Hyperthermus sp.]|nr:MAG: hypothetical protein DSY37_01550 [Hyperthermus sp.]